jgi:hypothetical protein
MQIGSHQVARGVVVLAFVVLGIRLLQLIDHYAVNILFWDQWDFLTGFFEGRGWWDLFTWQHSAHRQGLGNLSIYALYSLSGWDVRVEAFAAGVIVYAASLVAVLVKRQLFHTLVWTDVCIPLIFLTLAQYEIFIGTPNLAHGSLPLLLVMLFCLAMLNTRPLMRLVLCLIINFVAIYTGFALFLGLVTIVFLALLLVHRVREHQEVLLHAVALGVALASFASFFLSYTFVQPDFDCFLLPDYISFLAFIVGRPFGITRFVGIKVWLSLGILAMLVVTSLTVSWRMLCASHPSRLVQVMFVLTTFSLLFSAHTAAGRLCLGVDTAGSSRYVPYNLPAIFGLYLGLLKLAHFRPRAAQVLVTLFVILCVIKEIPARQDNATIHSFANGKQAWKNCYLRSEDIAACDKSTGFPIYPIPQATRLSEKLQYLKDHRLNLYKDAPAP